MYLKKVCKIMTIVLDTGHHPVFRYLSRYRDECDPWVKLTDSKRRVKSIRC